MKLYNSPLVIFPENIIWNSKKIQPSLWTNYGWIDRERLGKLANKYKPNHA